MHATSNRSTPNFVRARVGAEIRLMVHADHVKLQLAQMRILADSFAYAMRKMEQERGGVWRLLRLLDRIELDETLDSASSGVIAQRIATKRCATSDELIAWRFAELAFVGCDAQLRYIGKVIGVVHKMIRWENDPYPYHPIVFLLPELRMPAAHGGRIFRARSLSRRPFDLEALR